MSDVIAEHVFDIVSDDVALVWRFVSVPRVVYVVVVLSLNT
jgi:hypothetical protein